MLQKELYNIDLRLDVLTKSDDVFEEPPSQVVISDFSSASEETKQILRNQMYVKSELDSSVKNRDNLNLSRVGTIPQL